jgi:hypothetical protein
MNPQDGSPPRLVPDRPLPPYTHVPGRTPHPVNDPGGHRYGRPPEEPAPLDPARWRENAAYLHGIDLFNAGFYWEAHEEWEGLWHRAGRRGPVADFLKGLIKLAAAGVKVYQARPAGVAGHARRAAELFRGLAGGPGRFAGLSFAALAEAARSAENTACPPGQGGARPVFSFVLRPDEGG